MMGKGRLWMVSSVLGVISWLGLAYVVYSTDPEADISRLAFLILLFVALLTTFSPLAHFLHFRFTAARSYRSDMRRSFREGGLAALFLVLCAWLRMNQALNWINALLVLSALALIEAFILVRSS
jgi:hypothetical protein